LGRESELFPYSADKLLVGGFREDTLELGPVVVNPDPKKETVKNELSLS